MKRAIFLLALMGIPVPSIASGHGPLFGLATPTNSQGEFSFDFGVFGRNGSLGTQTSARALVGYGFTPHLTLSVTAPLVLTNALLPPTRIQPSGDFESTVAWRFHHNATSVGTRFESTAFGGVIVPGSQAGFSGLARTNNLPGTTVGAVTGMASRSHYVWLGGTFTKFYAWSGNRRPDVFDYSLVYGYRPPAWRTPSNKWDWRLFGELVGERSNRFLQASSTIAGTQAHQVFVGPTALGIYRNYTLSFGAQFPIYRDVGALFPNERVRFAFNFSYLLFQHSH